MTETDHGDFPIAVHMTSQLLHVLLVLCPHHVKLTLPTSSKINTNECDGIPSVDMSNITDVCADTHHRDVSLPHRTQHVLDTCIHTCPLSPTSTGQYLTHPSSTTVLSSSTSSPHSLLTRTYVPTYIHDEHRQCLHAHMSTSDTRSKCDSTHLASNGVPPPCHVMVPWSDSELTYRRDSVSDTDRINPLHICIYRIVGDA